MKQEPLKFSKQWWKWTFSKFVTILILLSGLLMYQSVLAQKSQIEWLVGHDQKKEGLEDFPKGGLVTADGDYVSAGLEKNMLIVIKISIEGKTKWVFRLGSKGNEYGATCIEETSDGHLLVGGFHSKNNFQERVLLKLDGSSGQSLWIKHYANSRFGAIEGIDETSTNEIIMAGYINGTNRNGFLSMDSEGIIMKVDSEGELIWEKKLIGKENDPIIPNGMRIIQDQSNGGYIISTTVYKEKNIDMDFCLIKTDDSGRIDWIQTYGGPRDEHCYDMDLTLDGGYIMTGHTTSPPSVAWDAYLVRADKYGNQVWDKRFGEPLNGDPRKIFDECYGVKATPDGGYIISCGTGIEPGFFDGPSFWHTWRILAVKTDSNGAFEWNFTSENLDGEKAGEYVENTTDGGYMIFVDGGNTEFLKLKESVMKSNQSFKLTTTSIGQGYIDPSKRYYPADTTITLTARPDKGYQFVGWSGDLSGMDNPIRIFINSAKNVQANFKKQANR